MVLTCVNGTGTLNRMTNERQNYSDGLAIEWPVGTIGYVDHETTYELAGHRVEVMAVFRNQSSDGNGFVTGSDGRTFIAPLYVVQVRAFEFVDTGRESRIIHEIVSLGALVTEDEHTEDEHDV